MAEGNRATAGRTSAAHHHDDDHGHSVAAWSLVGIVLVGALISSFAMVLDRPWLFWVGIAVAIVGLIVGKVLQAMGFGKVVYTESAPTDPDRQQGIR